MPEAHYEQAVYGSFAFRDTGYGPLAHSPGCRPEWRAAFASACQKFGEPAGAGVFPGAVFSLRLPDRGPWAIVGVSPAGHDDRGRPGALAFHALFVPEEEFRKALFDPFALAGALRADWGPEAADLPPGVWPVAESPPIVPGDEAGRIVARLVAGRRVAIESAGPVEGLARAVWAELPEKVRKRASLATWAFANGNHFDLLAVPRLEAIEWDASYADLPTPRVAPPIAWRCIRAVLDRVCRRVVPSGPPPPSPRGWASRHHPTGPRHPIDNRSILTMAALFVTGIAVASVALARKNKPEKGPIGPPPAQVEISPAPAPPGLGPDRSSYRDDPPDPAEVRAVARGLAEFADRFGIPLDGDPPDPTAAMVRLADRLRYRGALLDEAGRARLAKEAGPGKSRALAWDAQIRLFAPDRVLPQDFRRGPLRWKSETFAWTFHVDPDPRLATADIPNALADSLTLDEPIGPNPLAAKYPALADYAQFLARLPRR